MRWIVRACKCGAYANTLFQMRPSGAKRASKIKLFTYSVLLFCPLFFFGLIILFPNQLEPTEFAGNFRHTLAHNVKTICAILCCVAPAAGINCIYRLLCICAFLPIIVELQYFARSSFVFLNRNLGFL